MYSRHLKGELCLLLLDKPFKLIPAVNKNNKYSGTLCLSNMYRKRKDYYVHTLSSFIQIQFDLNLTGNLGDILLYCLTEVSVPLWSLSP